MQAEQLTPPHSAAEGRLNGWQEKITVRFLNAKKREKPRILDRMSCAWTGTMADRNHSSTSTDGLRAAFSVNEAQGAL